MRKLCASYAIYFYGAPSADWGSATGSMLQPRLSRRAGKTDEGHNLPEARYPLLLSPSRILPSGRYTVRVSICSFDSLSAGTVHVYSLHTDPFAQPGSGDAGGMNVYIARSIQAMLTLCPGLNIEVFTLAGGAEAPPKHPRLRVHYLAPAGVEQATKEELPAFVGAFALAATAAAVRVPDVIHSHYWLSGVAALRAAHYYADEYSRTVPTVFTPHTLAAVKNAHRGANEAPEPAHRRHAEADLMSRARLVIANTPLEATQLHDYYGVPATRVQVITPGVDTDIFHPVAGVLPANKNSTGACRLVFAGRPQPLKGPHLLVEALGLLPEDLRVRLDIMGRADSAYERGLHTRARELGVYDRVHFHAPVPAARLAQIFRRADIVASPSSSESFGLVALEAQAAGAAVLASDVDGLRYAVENRVSGLLVSPRTPSAWAKAIEHLVRSPQLRRTLGNNAAARAQRFSWEATAKKTLRAYALALAS